MTRLTVAHDSSDPGLQAERTILSWTRTSVAVLANGALVTVKILDGEVGPLDMVLPVFAAFVTLGGFVIALQRQATLARRPLPVRITARHQVYLMSAAVLILIALTTMDEVIR